ncbi:helix-turn-helix transcriptional regulator [Actinomadura rayongensis]|uniref:Helix-turn-helix domain-containing protein n=1 Tax=Actinomadura rayongensis TaxID=1429076 RepID=A0A6I4WD91_9ACTN|nr:helix-turn-helix transcriptional regulator [Actinomadura rayongensis]MXQ68197.1 helix-turn-helix domain-containing protein [Actinomadura rayongensis]
MTASPDARRRDDLRDFLRSRRARLTPADVGMPSSGRRRTPGLRREEVAVLAGVGVSWYTWLEQGRDIKVSGDVLDAIAGALRLDRAEREHLYLLAGLNPPRAEPEAVTPTPELRQVLDAWSPRPGYIRDRHWNFLVINDAARACFGYGDTDHNCLVTFFTSARYRRMNAHWAESAPGVVARFRADAARFPEDPEFARIAADLAAVSPEFADLWDRHEVTAHAQAVKAIRHPEAGEMVFDAVVLALPDAPGCNLVLHHPHPGTGTDERLERLMARIRLANPA